MAEKVDHLPELDRRPARRYPWEDWMDGDVWKLRRGEDFDVEADVFRNRLYSVSAKKGKKVATRKRVEDGTEILLVQFFDRDDPRFAELNGQEQDDEAGEAADLA